MGEYATFNGERVKIGTCEDMLYLRWDQRHLVTDSDTPLFDPEVLAVIRFRFPFPWEDGAQPGAFPADYSRDLRLWGFEQPKEVEHGTLQLTSRTGYLLNLPCPEGKLELVANGERIDLHKNGYHGGAALVAQALRGGRLVGIAQCLHCRVLYRLEDGYEEAAAVAIRSEADRKMRDFEMSKTHRDGIVTHGDKRIADELHEVADRLLAGYRVEVAS